MPSNVLTHTDCGSAESLKEKWLASLGLAGDKSVIDCDISAQTVTFQTDDGPFVRQIVECWSRVMGYHRPVSSWNTGKQQEHADRRPFTERTAEYAGLLGSHNDRDIRDYYRERMHQCVD